ncbi:hypothetical protein [Lysobacter terrae]
MSTTANLECLAQLLEAEMPHAAFQRRVGPDGPELVIRSPSDQVGELVITDDGDELTVCIGTFTHSHWGCFDSTLPAEQRPEQVAKPVLEFISAILSDRIEFFGASTGGGSRPVGKPRGWLSRLMFGSTTYRWSGPVSG